MTAEEDKGSMGRESRKPIASPSSSVLRSVDSRSLSRARTFGGVPAIERAYPLHMSVFSWRGSKYSESYHAPYSEWRINSSRLEAPPFFHAKRMKRAAVPNAGVPVLSDRMKERTILTVVIHERAQIDPSSVHVPISTAYLHLLVLKNKIRMRTPCRQCLLHSTNKKYMPWGICIKRLIY